MTQPSNYQPYTFDRVVRIVFAAVGIVATLYVLKILKGVLLPFLVACLIAYMLEPLVKWNMRWTHLRHRFIPVVLTLIEVTALVGGIGYLIVPYLISETQHMALVVKQFATNQINIPFLSSDLHRFIRDNVDFDYISRLFTREEWRSIIKTTLTSTWSVFSSSVAVVVGIVSWMVVFLYVIFIMIDYERLMLSFRQLVPYSHRHRVFRIVDDIEDAMNRYFRGQALIAAIVGCIYCIGFSIIGVPMAIALGILVGVLNMVPYLMLVSLPFTALMCAVATMTDGTDFWIMFGQCCAVYVVGQGTSDLILTPKIMGKFMGLNPAIILLSLSVWGALLGFMGLIIALPLTTLVLSYYNLYVIERQRRKNLLRRSAATSGAGSASSPGSTGNTPPQPPHP